MSLLTDIAGLITLAKVQADQARADEKRAEQAQSAAVAAGQEVTAMAMPVAMAAIARAHEEYLRRLLEILNSERARIIGEIDSWSAQQGLPGATRVR